VITSAAQMGRYYITLSVFAMGRELSYNRVYASRFQRLDLV